MDMLPILYHSTNMNMPEGYKQEVSFREALFMGMAPDGGLFMPSRIPKFSKREILNLRGKPYHEVAGSVLWKFLKQEFAEKELDQITRAAYNFPLPIEKLDKLTFVARLDKGPTASFKDFAARFMAKAMEKLREKDFTILVATSGDTGSAVGHAFRGLKGVKVFILYPEKEVSSVQKIQLDNIGQNVQAVAVKGKFDDCQNLVKQAFSDKKLGKLNLTSANSINIGRILPQVAYYFYAYVNAAEDFEEIFFAIPSGNFGNSLGCEMARRMGLPARLIISVNENDEFPRFMETGVYKKIRHSRACISNAMNVGNPSNLARYFELFSGTLDKEGITHKKPFIGKMRKFISSYSISDDETIKTIKDVYSKYDYVLEPHGAVAFAAMNRHFKKKGKVKTICLETAEPAKFPEIVESVLKIKLAIPDSMKHFNGNEAKPDNLDNNYEKLREYLLKKC